MWLRSKIVAIYELLLLGYSTDKGLQLQHVLQLQQFQFALSYG